MGCDIHMFAEKRVNGKWEIIRHNLQYVYDDGSVDEDDNEIDIDRNYTLFGLLAGVREQLEVGPISQPKGLPEDCCKEIRAQYEHWDTDGRDHSYLTLKEILDFDWLQKISVSWEKEMIRASKVAQDDILSVVVPFLWKQAEPQNVRIVFWFDN